MSSTSSPEHDPSSCHNLLSDVDYKYQYPARPSTSTHLLACPEYFDALETRFPGIDLAMRQTIKNVYISYRSQAEKLKTEADKPEDQDAWQSIEEELGIESQRPLGTVTNKPKTDADQRETVKTLRDMRAICLTRVRILETGSLTQIQQLEKMDAADDKVVQELYDRDEVMQDHLVASWTHLENDWERLLRLRLIFLIVSSEKRKDWEVDDLAGDLDAMEMEGDDDKEIEKALEEVLVELEMEELLEKMKL